MLCFMGIFLILIIFSTLFVYYFLMDNLYEPIIITDVDEYSAIFDIKYPEKHIDYETKLFPKTIDNLDVQKYEFIHKTYSLFGTGWQIVLDIRYDNDSFSEEVERIKSLCKNSPIYGISEHFENQAYATVWKNYNCYEYAIVDEKNSQIAYVYLQLVPPEKITIEKKYIPKDYDELYRFGDEKTHIFSIYQ